jgi:type IV pilus assembly protein PilF
MTIRQSRFLGVVFFLMGVLAGCGSGPATSVRLADPITESDQTQTGRRALLRLVLAESYLQSGQALVALDEVKQALLLSPQLPAAWTLRGLTYLQLGDAARARESFDRAFALAPDDADVLHNRGWLRCQGLASDPSVEDAQALLRRALSQPGYRHPDRSWLALALCQERIGEPSRALESLSRVAQEPTAQPQTLWQAARMARRLDNPELVGRLGLQLRTPFGQSPQAAAFDKGSWDD